MRPPRLVILIIFTFACLFVLCRSVSDSARSGASASPARTDGSSLWSFMYYNVPFSLFPPNAAISLTDDNSTSFPARPAAFGPKLAPNGLSGQLWVGSGFAEDTLDGDGELGCSDIPSSVRLGRSNPYRTTPPRLDSGSRLDISDDEPDAQTDVDVGLDDYLRDSLSSSSYPDIQSLQESAEIDGKIVLLMRGGCGFLEKVMWAQRRGAVAVIVGDNQKGGPLIQMFAHGDEVDNITIPSVFTARMTAQLLSSLTQPGTFIEDSLDENGDPVIKVQQGLRANRNRVIEQHRRPPVTPIRNQDRAISAAKTDRWTADDDDSDDDRNAETVRRDWVSRALGWDRAPRKVNDRTRTPRSARLDSTEVRDKTLVDSMVKGKKQKKTAETTDDGFVIGVHDWRDPDLVERAEQTPKKRKAKGSQRVSAEADGPQSDSTSSGAGSIAKDDNLDAPHRALREVDGDANSNGASNEYIAGSARDHTSEPVPVPSTQPHEGLWVTITPTSSASPFFDTLLVLVISPLVTLSIVYALLILRARIRRRRWRAPKSVVERLPVRTYHTVAPLSGASTRLPSPSSNSPTTPLLQQQSPIPTRPRSRTTSGAPESGSFRAASAAVPARLPPPRTREHEKGGFSPEWRKYMGRQVECVVCLEEYVDGVSRVMSLPCGHEFHVDCITPWLTTRRRTCPICKGDVVRSLAHGSGSGPRYSAYQEESDDELDAEPSTSRSARDTDPEHGLLSNSTEGRRRDRQDWFGFLSANMTPRPRSSSPPPDDRDR